MEQDFLGSQLMLAVSFLESGFDPNLQLEDTVASQSTRASEVFSCQEERWFMRDESIPGHLAIKAIGVDENGLYIETSPLNAEKVQEVIQDLMLPFAYDAKGGTFSDTTTRQPLIRIGSPVKVPELGARCLWTIPLKGIKPIRWKAVIRLADALFTADAYDVEPIEQETFGPIVSEPAVKKMSMQLQISLHQRLEIEQRPILSLRQELRPQMLGEMRLELRKLLAIEQKILNMSPQELEEFVVRHAIEHGEERTRSILLFAIAGRIKAVAQELTWREARKISLKLVAKA